MDLAGEELVTVTRGDLYLLITCAASYNTRLPYGLVPPRLWDLLTAEMQASFQQSADDDERC